MSPIRPENRSRYPAEWPAIRARILARAQDRCEWCGVPNYAVGYRDESGDFVPGRGNRVWDAAGRGQLPYAEARELAEHANCCTDGRDDDGNRWIVVVLTIAHVDDSAPENCAEENLAALCQRCHNRHDAKERAAGVRTRRQAPQLDLLGAA